MSYVYDETRHGDSLYAKLIHQVAVREEPMAMAIGHRKDLIRKEIDKTVANPEQGSSRPSRIMSLACGPAQEVHDYVQGVVNPQKNETTTGTSNDLSNQAVEFTLIDQDQQALGRTNSLLARVLIPSQVPVKAKYLHIGFLPLIKNPAIFETLAEQDLIYSAGFIDYLPPKVAQRLIEKLASKLAVGGRLMLGNYTWPNDATWCLRYWMDWELIYRTKDQLLDLGGPLPSTYRKEIITEVSGYTNFLVVTKTA